MLTNKWICFKISTVSCYSKEQIEDFISSTLEYKVHVKIERTGYSRVFFLLFCEDGSFVLHSIKERDVSTLSSSISENRWPLTIAVVKIFVLHSSILNFGYEYARKQTYLTRSVQKTIFFISKLHRTDIIFLSKSINDHV